MEDLRRPGAHDAAGDLGGGRVQDEVLELRDALPVAVILEEPAGFAAADILDGEGAGRRQVALEAGPQGLDPILEGAADDHDAVPGIGGLQRLQLAQAKGGLLHQILGDPREWVPS